jgi:uncharacterized protein with HEPN domain
MSAHDADLTLRQMLEVCDKAIELWASMTWEEFRGDWRKQMLGERLVEILGEAVKRLPDDLYTVRFTTRQPAFHFVQWHKRRGVLPVAGQPGLDQSLHRITQRRLFQFERAPDNYLPLPHRQGGQFFQYLGKTHGGQPTPARPRFQLEFTPESFQSSPATSPTTAAIP